MGDPPHPATTDERGAQAARVSKLVVGLIVELTGRGPDRVRTTIGDDVIHVVLREQLTKTDIGLIASGQSELVLAIRRAVQDSASARLVAGVEMITGRTVEAFLSANHLSPDVSVESFILEPLRKPTVVPEM